MASLRKPCVAGMFYPAQPHELNEMLNELLNQAQDTSLPSPKAIIAPHAGYIYSGGIAAKLYSMLQKDRGSINKVVLLGPAHRCLVKGIATTQVDLFATPLGEIEVDHLAINEAAKLSCVDVLEQAYQNEHCLEVQLPFLQTVLHQFKIAPFIVGDSSPKEVAQLIELLWGDEKTLIVISSDLSHYHDYETAQKLDAATTQAIVDLKPELIKPGDACGRLPIQGLLLAAKNKSLKVHKLDTCNSGDTAGDKSKVVGYGAYYIKENS